MAADRAGPWSRWDGLPGDANQINPAFPAPQFDAPASTGQLTSGQTTFIRSTLVDQRVNTIDPSFYDCVYGVANSAQTVIEQCYKDLGCCANGCCKNSDWQRKYGWAVALIVIFCIIVIFAVSIWLVVWLINRSKDKRQKRQLIGGSGVSPANSQMSLALPIQGGYHYGTGPFQTPPARGYRY